jgi:pyruvate dehydrogenase E2 component (dihydrolipoamide acetyltransferase)
MPAAAPAPVPPQAPRPAGPSAPATARARVSPAARRRAAELGLAADALPGTGADGAVTLADVELAARRPRPPAAPPRAARTGFDPAEMRAAIAAAMARSKREIPHYYLSEPVPMRRALDWLREANTKRPVTERLLPAVLLIKATALALREFPELNGWLDGGGRRPSASVHVGVAVSLRGGGLIAPALHDVPELPLERLMTGLADLVRRARAGGLRSSELTDPTVTVTNLGDQGVEVVHGVIYPPQVALVGFGRIAERPWVDAGAVVAMPTVTASLAADHRASDGHRGALFLARLGALLQQPEAL